MPLHLDHLVILCDNLAAVAADYTAQGFAVTPGGVHADGLTHNALVVFADGTYLELIAFVDAADPRDNVWGWRQFSARGGGLIDYCCAVDDLSAAVGDFRARGLQVGVPSDGGRQRPDGVQLRWRSARFWQAGRELPFLIEDVTPRELRVPQGGAHANGVLGIAELSIAVADLPRLARTVAALVAQPLPELGGDRRYDTQTASFTLPDGQILTLAAPTSRTSALQQRIETLGLGPCMVRWRMADGAAPRAPQTWFGPTAH